MKIRKDARKKGFGRRCAVLLPELMLMGLLIGGCGAGIDAEIQSAAAEIPASVTEAEEDIRGADETGRDEEEHVHNVEVQWYGDPPDCLHGGYRIALCTVCGWVDEDVSGEVPALAHTPEAEEIQRGNCREDTIITYTCTICKEQVGYERHTEPDEHTWVIKNMQVWDEKALEFITYSVECCERCNTVKQEEG